MTNWDKYRDVYGYINLASAFQDSFKHELSMAEPTSSKTALDFLEGISKLQQVRSRQVAALAVSTAGWILRST